MDNRNKLNIQGVKKVDEINWNKYEIVIVGAGISGAVLAERYANVLDKKVLIIEKRTHIAGNCYDFYDNVGVRVSKYGAHLFHTNSDEVMQYVRRFSDWYFYEHRVLALVDEKLVPVPVNIKTVNLLLDQNIQTERQMKKWLKENQIKFENPINGEEAALSRVGKELYEKIFKNYTFKQWNKMPSQLDASVLNRIPVRTSFDDRYFSDKYQFLPSKGYTQIFEKMLDHKNIDIVLEVDYIDVRSKLSNNEKLFFTGPIDQFFDFKFSNIQKLEYRSINFVFESYKKEYFQQNSVINYPNQEKFTRIVEYKYFTKQKLPYTTISKEYSVDHVPGVNEPYYPIPNPDNTKIYQKYKDEADKIKNVYFVGRLANYKYFNMDEAFKNALDLFSELESSHL
ncbi:MAG: UDP-galactopyranose mutase [Patescibacteria group bacterium]